MQGFSQEFQNIIKRLKNNDPTLMKLDLSVKKLTDKHAIVLGKALEINRTLLSNVTL